MNVSEESEPSSAATTEMGPMKDWRKALRSPPAYRVVNRTLRNQTKFLSIIGITSLVILFILYVFPKRTQQTSQQFQFQHEYYTRAYNHSYPLTNPLITKQMHTFRIGIISDLDTNSKSSTEPYTWFSYYQKGYLSYSPSKQSVVVSWDESSPIRLTSSYSLKDRGMELSELVVFDGRIITFDDRTGLVYEVVNDKVVPWTLLMDGDGKSGKGFKTEWATVKNDILYAGSMGKEWTTPSGEFGSHDPQYIKAITQLGQVSHLNWIEPYERIRSAIGIEFPGYMIHESGVWSDIHQRWFFLPRRCSTQRYNETLDEHMGCSVLISSDESFYDIKITKLPNHLPTRGYSSFKFIPGTQDTVVVALRTEEVDGKTATYICSFTIDGVVLLFDTFIANLKYEGFEFI